MSWLQALQAMARPSGAISTVASRTRLFDTVAEAHLFGPPGFQCSSEGLRVVRGWRWHLLATGTTTMKSTVLGHMLRVYGAATQAMSTHTLLPSSRDVSPGLLDPALEGLLVEQVQCLAEAKVHGVRLQPWHVKALLTSPLLALTGPELALLVLREVTRGDAAPVESIVDCAAGLASAGCAQAAWELLSAHQHDPAVAAAFPGLVESVLASHRAGHERAVALVQQIPAHVFLGHSTAGDEAVASQAGSLRGWVDGATRAYERSAQSHPATTAAAAWLTQLVSLLARAPTSVSPDVACAVWEAALRLSALTSAQDPHMPPWRTLVDAVCTHNARVAGTQDACAVPLAKVGRYLRRIGQPTAYLELLCGSPEAVQRVLCHKDGKGVEALQQSVASALALQDQRDAGLYNEAMLALAALGAWTVAIDVYEAWLHSAAAACQEEDSSSTCLAPPPTASTHWCLLRLLLRPNSVQVGGEPATATAPPALTDAVYMVCRRALERLIADLSNAADVSGKAGLPSKRVLADSEGLSESLILWAAARGEWQDAVMWAAYVPTRQCRYAHLVALAAAAQARAALVTTNGPSPSPAPSLSAGKHAVSDVEETMMHMISCIVRAPDRTWKQLSLLTAALSTTLAVPASLEHDDVLGRTASPLVVLEEPRLVPELQSDLVEALVESLSTCVGPSQALMDDVTQQTVEYYVSLRHRCLAGRYHTAVSQDALWLAERVRGRGQLLDSTLQLVAEAASAAHPRNMTQHGAENTHDDPLAVVQSHDSGEPVADWHIMAQVLRATSQRTGLSMARAAPAMVSAGLKAEVALDFLA